MDNLLPTAVIETIPGIMGMHQITYNQEKSLVNLRRLSCYECDNQTVCSHYHMGQVLYGGKNMKGKIKNNSLKRKFSDQMQERMSVSNNGKFLDIFLHYELCLISYH